MLQLSARVDTRFSLYTNLKGSQTRETASVFRRLRYQIGLSATYCTLGCVNDTLISKDYATSEGTGPSSISPQVCNTRCLAAGAFWGACESRLLITWRDWSILIDGCLLGSWNLEGLHISATLVKKFCRVTSSSHVLISLLSSVDIKLVYGK